MSGTLRFLHFTFESGSFNEVEQTAPCLPGNEKSASRGLNDRSKTKSFIHSTVSPTQWGERNVLHPGVAKMTKTSPASRSLSGWAQMRHLSPVQLCWGGLWAYLLVQGPQRRRNSLWISRSFSKNNSVLLTNICSISKFLNIQQTLVLSTNICSLVSVDSVPALCLPLGGNCRHRARARPVLGQGRGLVESSSVAPSPCLSYTLA